MELGNLIFGNSRGNFKVPREVSFEGPWRELCDELKVNWYGFRDEGCLIEGDTWELDTEVFTIRSYYWGDDEEKGTLPNFLYKPTGFTIDWYKYPFRDSYMSEKIKASEWREIIRHCIESVKDGQSD